MQDKNAEILEKQVMDLQIMVAYLEDTIHRLDGVIAKQDKQMQNMQRQLQLIYAQVNGDKTQGIAPFDVLADKPPHY